MGVLNTFFIKDYQTRDFSLTRDLLLKTISSCNSSNVDIKSIIQRRYGTVITVSDSEQLYSDLLKTGIVIGRFWYPVVEAIAHKTITVLALDVPNYITDDILTNCIRSSSYGNITDTFSKYYACYTNYTLDVGVRKIIVPVATELPLYMNPRGPDGIYRNVALWTKDMFQLSEESFIAQ